MQYCKEKPTEVLLYICNVSVRESHPGINAYSLPLSFDQST